MLLCDDMCAFRGCREIKTGAHEWKTLGTLTFHDQTAKKGGRKREIQDQVVPESKRWERLLGGRVWSELSVLWRGQEKHALI